VAFNQRIMRAAEYANIRFSFGLEQPMNVTPNGSADFLL
jgi:hypothetical protein